MRVTWYVMEDGSIADPSTVALDDKGVLRDKSGRGVKMRAPDCPMSRSVEVSDTPKAAAKDMQPQSSGAGYLTRDGSAGAAASESEKSSDTSADIAALRAEYQKAFGKHPFHGWDAAALREKIAAKAAD